MRKRVLILSLVGLAFAGGFFCAHFYKEKTETAADTRGGRKVLYYYDPMHPDYISETPGVAPDCNMALVPFYADEHVAGAAHGAKKERTILYYHDPMHPSYRSDKPGIAPDCNMALEPVYADQESEMSASSGPPLDTVHITPEKQQLIGVRYGAVEYGSAVQTIRAAARISMDENKIARVQSKYEGWIDQVFVTLVGTEVRKNQPLLTIYNPQSVASQMEFIKHSNRGFMMGMPTAITGAINPSTNQPVDQPAQISPGNNQPADQTPAGSSPNMPNYEALLAADRYRLQQMGFDDEVLAVIAKSRTPMWKLIVRSPIDGVVIERNGFPKQRATPETMYTIADLSTVWVTADFFEYEGSVIQVGQTAALTLPYLPGKTFKGRVDSILPSLDPTTRTLKVRMVFDNPNNLLRPEMYGDVELRTGGARRLLVPREAVLDSGLRRVVFVDKGNGYFEPREVNTGRQFGDRVEVLSGLKAGERVVTSGNFLIDSESQLKASRAGHDRSNH